MLARAPCLQHACNCYPAQRNAQTDKSLLHHRILLCGIECTGICSRQDVDEWEIVTQHHKSSIKGVMVPLLVPQQLVLWQRFHTTELMTDNREWSPHMLHSAHGLASAEAAWKRLPGAPMLGMRGGQKWKRGTPEEEWEESIASRQKQWCNCQHAWDKWTFW